MLVASFLIGIYYNIVSILGKLNIFVLTFKHKFNFVYISNFALLPDVTLLGPNVSSLYETLIEYF